MGKNRNKEALIKAKKMNEAMEAHKKQDLKVVRNNTLNIAKMEEEVDFERLTIPIKMKGDGLTPMNPNFKFETTKEWLVLSKKRYKKISKDKMVDIKNKIKDMEEQNSKIIKRWEKYKPVVEKRIEYAG